ncbi:sorting nexin-33 isoform X2 [Protobothrops mucrosquamatus]|uniref:sorting nexin-33 isoform X2 n=1 Tax=Protobothrops mucrosquamatus TaxID=103944 RepID=UPI000775CE18|nr:sorting nexin-33 isoform X2 [Protobothrops mucrosquamatus]
MAVQARALYDFQSENKEEISIRENEELVLFNEKSLDGWLQGTNSRGETGLFPASYVEILRSRSSSTYTNCSNSPTGSPGNGSSFYVPPSAPGISHQGSFEDDEDDWDDWDDDGTVVEEPRSGAGTNGHPSPSLSCPRPYAHPNNVGSRAKPSLERQDSIGSSKRGSVVSRNLNRFSSFVRSGVEAFILGDVPMMGKISEAYYIDMGSKGPQWRSSPHPFLCSVEEPTKQTKFKGIKSYISYRLTPSNGNSPVYRRYKHFDWLYNRLLHKFTIISVPHLPEKQATGRFGEDFIEKRKRRLILWMDHMTSHPALSQYEGFQHFLTCGDNKQWKMGKRRAEKDEMVGASFLLTLQIPTEHQDLQDVEDRVDIFKAFNKKMDDSVLQLTSVASELGLLSNFPDIIHLQKGAFAKVKESQRMSDEGKMDQEEADGIRKRCRVVGFALQAEMNYFHERRILDFKKMMQSYIREQIVFYQRVSQKLEETLRRYDNL